MGMRQHEREHVFDQRRWRGHEWGGGKGGEKQTTGAEECETEYEPVEAGLRDEGGLPTFSVRQQELGGKANLDGPSIPTARDDHSRTGWAYARLQQMRRLQQPAAASLVIRHTSDQISRSRCTCLWGARRRLYPCRTTASPRWHCERFEPVIW